MKGVNSALTSVICAIGLSVSGAAVLAQTTEQIATGNAKVCAQVCGETLSYCTEQRGRLGEQSVTDALKDCISACKMAQDFIARGSMLQPKVAAIAVEACDRTAKTCEAFKGDKVMNSTANECRKTSGNLSKIVSKATASK